MTVTDKLHVLITYALEEELLERLRAVDPRIEIEVLGQDQRRLLPRGGCPRDARAAAKLTLGKGAPRLKWIQLTSAGADRLLNSGFIEEGVTVTTASGLH